MKGFRFARRFAAVALVFAVAQGAQAQDPYAGRKVANFSLPAYNYDSPRFESFSFWSGPKDGNSVGYAYGKGGTEVKLRALGPNPDGKGFAVQFPNGLVLDIEPRGDVLLVSDRAGKYHKTFEWQYEGPVDGRGTFCQVCVEEAEAMPFVRGHFMK
jgi:hypothetical protein